MKLITHGRNRNWKAGLLVDGWIVGLTDAARLAGWPDDLAAGLTSNRALLAFGVARALELEAAVKDRIDELRISGQAISVDNVRLGPPIPDPEKIICIGLNYHDHAREVGARPPQSPIFFAKFANSLIGPADDIVPPRDEEKVDYEAELAVVIGKAGRYIEPDAALSHLAGAFVFNDVSARDLQLANQLWTSGKAVDTFGPCGPLVIGEETGDLQALGLRTRVNGDLLQDGTTANMIFSIAEIIVFLSRIMTLEPGDIIATGTPAGVASAHRPARYLKTGDVVEVEIDNLGSIRNRIVDAL